MGVYSRDGNYHRIRRNKATRTPQRAVFLDTETDFVRVGEQDRHTLRLGWTFYYRKDRFDIDAEAYWRLHLTADSLWEYVESLCTAEHPLYLFGHNLFFDLQSSGFFPHFTTRGWKREFHYFDNGNFVLVIEKDKRRIRAVSTTNYFDFPLKTLGKLVGLPKMDVDFGSVDSKQLIDYCRNDVKILVLAMTQYWQFITDYQLGNFAMTRASQAMAAYRHRFMTSELVVHDDEKIIALERQAYMGGRVEAWYIGELKHGEYVSLDINSMYPFVMRQAEYPTRFVDYKTNVPIEELTWILKRFAVIARLRISTTVPAYSLRENGKLLFPVGKFDAYVSTAGALYALTHGHIRTCLEIACYEKAPIFEQWVDEIYPLKAKFREEGNAVYSQIVKILMNSLYGKFGQTLPDEHTIDAPNPVGYWRINGLSLVTGEQIVETQVLNRYSESRGRVTSDKAIYSIAAHVTENARMLLWSIMEKIGTDRILYVDTDSIKIRAADLWRVDYPIHPTQLGALALEKTFHSGSIYGAKDYVLDGEVTLKGVPSNAKAVAPNTFEYTHFPGQASHLRAKVDDYFIVEHVVKRLSRQYDKGIVTPSGLVVPLHLDRW